MRRRQEVHDVEDDRPVVDDGASPTPTGAAYTQSPRRLSRWRPVLLGGLYLLAVVSLVVGVERAQTRRRVPVVEPTLVLIIDVSGSMKADDVKPDRLNAAKRSADEFVAALPAAVRVGLVAFSGTVQIAMAPTSDRDQVRRAIEDLDASGGTAMGDALFAGLSLVRPETSPAGAPAPATGPQPAGRLPASLVLISDGANTLGERQPLDVAALAAHLEVPIYTVALGTAEGQALIPDGRGGQRIQAVPPDPETLRGVARVTDGQFHAAPSARRLVEVYDELEPRVTHREVRRKAVYWPLGASTALLVLAVGLTFAWRRRPA